MVKRVFAATGTVCLGIAIGVLLAFAGHSGTATAAMPQAAPLGEAASLSDLPESGSSQPAQEPGYYIKDYQGRVAVLKDGSQVPEMIFDIPTKMLPELDRIELARGIYVESYEEMLKLVEDYIS